MIKIKNLCKSYQQNKALNNLSLEIPAGKIFGLLGPNGAGKTTLISILNGIIAPDKGTIEVQQLSLKKNLKKVKNISALVPQSNAFYPNLSAYENLVYFAALYGLNKQQTKERIAFCAEIASLQNHLKQRAKTFSGGLKRRLNLAIGLLNDPQILYLDEPTAGVDPQARNHLLETIKKINRQQKTTIIYTSHYIEEVEKICDEVGILDHGKMIVTENLAKLTKGRKHKLEGIFMKLTSTQLRDQC